MNFLYFACPLCKQFTSAGYRRAYWHLEHAGIVAVNKPIEVEAVLSAQEFWHPPVEPGSDWLYKDVLPLVRGFLSAHTDHGIVFVESGDFFGLDDFDEWVEIENC